MSKTALIAVGGNSLIRAGEKGTVAEQMANARRTAAAIVGIIRSGYHVVVTHGNGPQVGAQLLRSERASDQIPSQTLDVCGAASQGEIGYILAQSLRLELADAGITMPVAAIISQTVVSRDDPAMQRATKPIGPFYSRSEAEDKKRQFGWQIVEDAARGYRRVVASPEPVEVLESPIIKKLMDDGTLVVACGGGGIPVVRNNGGVEGIEAVIDKDRASALLASELAVDLFVISTDCDCVYLDYKKPTQRRLERVSVTDLERYYAEGQFPAGNMGPKVESALRFIKNGGKEVIITSYEYLNEAVAGTAGTHITSETPVRTELVSALRNAG